MKNLFLMGMLVLFAFNTSFAQEPIRIGIKAGVNFASITGDDAGDLDSRTGIHFGALGDIPITESLSIRPGLIYSAQGADYSDSEEGSISFDGSFKLDYLNVPVALVYKAGGGFFIQAGPQIGFLLSAKDEYESPGDSGEDDIKDFVSSTDFGALFGVGYEFQGGFFIDAGYYLGLSNLWDSDFDDFDNKNGVFMVQIGYFFL